MTVMTILLRLILGLFVLAVAGLPAAAPADARPALWVVRDADTTVWLFGTVHELRPGDRWFTGPVRTAFDRSDRLVLELVAPSEREQQAALRTAAPPPGAPSLPDRLPAGYGAKLGDALAAVGYPRDAFDRTAPWVAATSLSVLPLRRAGFRRDQSPETVLATAATVAGKPVEGLEDQRAQVAMYADLPDAVQIAMLVRVLDGQAGAVAGMERVADAWTRGDVDALASITAQDMARSDAAVRDNILENRNARWARTVAEWMKAPGSRFLAVGTGHMVGPGGLPERLRAVGIVVERVQ